MLKFADFFPRSFGAADFFFLKCGHLCLIRYRACETVCRRGKTFLANISGSVHENFKYNSLKLWNREYIMKSTGYTLKLNV